jgi:hypothetical protein
MAGLRAATDAAASNDRYERASDVPVILHRHRPRARRSQTACAWCRCHRRKPHARRPHAGEPFSPTSRPKWLALATASGGPGTDDRLLDSYASATRPRAIHRQLGDQPPAPANWRPQPPPSTTDLIHGKIVSGQPIPPAVRGGIGKRTRDSRPGNAGRSRFARKRSRRWHVHGHALVVRSGSAELDCRHFCLGGFGRLLARGCWLAPVGRDPSLVERGGVS